MCTREEHEGFQISHTLTQHTEPNSFVFFDSALPCRIEREKTISKANSSNGAINQLHPRHSIYSKEDIADSGPCSSKIYFLLCEENNS